ncbi:MAG: hypothetical protein DWP95_10445 [Proteobacteria bacterium]|nr:MAG: hypothetical protein DWP95_10445 [Pseudomonadota bacterium]
MTILVELNYASSVSSPTQSVYFGINSFNVTGSTWADGRLMSPFKHKTSIKSWVQSDTSQTTIGDVKLANGDGELDYLLNKIGFIRVFRWPGSGGLGDEIAYAKVDKIVADGEKHILIKLKNPLDELDVPLQTNVFPASEPSEGSGLSPAPTNYYYGMEGQTRPLALGLCYNIQPFLANRAFNEYQCHDSEVFLVQNVYDNGISVSFTGHTKGFTLATDPNGTVVAKVIGGLNAGTNTQRVQYLIPEVMSRAGFSSYNSTDLTDLDTGYGYRYGYYQPAGTNQTALYVVKWVLDSSLFYMYAEPDGEIRFKAWEKPKITADDEMDVRNVVGGINIFSDEAPNLTLSIGASKNWYVYNQDDIAFGATAQNKIDMAASHLSVWKSSTPIAYDTSKDVYDSLLRPSVDALAVSDRLADIYSVRRNFYAFDSTKDASIGDTIELTYPRFGLETGKNLVVVGREIDFINNTYRLTLWG